MHKNNHEIMSAQEEKLRNKLLKVFDILSREKIFLHTKYLEMTSPTKFRMPLIAGLALLNAIVGNGAMLLWGGFGYGKTMLLKYLGRLLTSAPLEDIEASILRANPNLIEEKIVGRMDLGKLIKEGDEVIIWRRFVKAFWKIIDEINRLNPAAQDIILSLLGESIVKYFDEVFVARRYVLFATLNPRDVGVFPLGLPLLDRFGIAVVVKSPSLDDINEIALLSDDRVFKRSVPSILSTEELTSIWAYVEAMPLESSAQLFVSSLAKELSLCDRTDKETGIFIEFGSKICTGCPFENLDSVCKYTFTPLSVRAEKDLVKYSKALAWLMGLKTVPLSVVVTIAPYVIWHRLRFSDKYLEEFGFDRFRFAKHIVESVLRNFLKRLPLLQAYEGLKAGRIDPQVVSRIRRVQDSDLIIKYEIAPVIDMFLEDKYLNLVNELRAGIETKDRNKIEEILSRAKEELNATQYLALSRVYLRELRKHRYRLLTHFSAWKRNLDKISHVLSADLSDTLSPPVSVLIDRGFEEAEIIIVNNDDASPVIINLYSLWNDTLSKLKDILGEACLVS